MLYTDETMTAQETFSNINGLTDEQKQRIYDFLQGMVYSWCNANGETPFTNYHLTGDKNSYVWEYTPLVAVYDNRYHQYKADYPNATEDELNEWAFNQAPKDMGNLLKAVLIKDERKFIKMSGYNSTYRWVEDE